MTDEFIAGADQADSDRPLIQFKTIRRAYRQRKLLVWTLVGLGFVGAAAMGALFPWPREARVNLFPLSDLQITQYQEPDIEPVLKIDSQMMTTSFVDFIREGEVLRKTILDHKVVERGQGESEEAFQLRLEQAVRKLSLELSLVAPSPENIRAGLRNWIINYEGRSAEKGYAVLRDLINRTNDLIKAQLMQLYVRKEAVMVRGLEQRKADLTLKRQNMLADYDRTIAERLAQLQEQIGLMRASGNRTGQLVSQSNNFNPGQQIAVVDTSKVTYVPGYEQLEKNVELIRSRTEKEKFIDGLLGVDQELRGVQQDLKVQRARAAYERIFVNSALPFRAVYDDLTRASFSSPKSRLITSIGILLLGLLLAFAVVLSRAFALSQPEKD